MATIGSSRVPRLLSIVILLSAPLCIALAAVLVWYAQRSEPARLVQGYDLSNLDLDVSRYQVEPIIAQIERTQSDASSLTDLRWFEQNFEKAGPSSRANLEKACRAIKTSSPSGYCSLVRAN